MVALGGNNYAFRACVNGLYMCAEEGGKKALVTNRPHVQLWETFEVFFK